MTDFQPCILFGEIFRDNDEVSFCLKHEPCKRWFYNDEKPWWTAYSKEILDIIDLPDRIRVTQDLIENFRKSFIKRFYFSHKSFGARQRYIYMDFLRILEAHVALYINRDWNKAKYTNIPPRNVGDIDDWY